MQISSKVLHCTEKGKHLGRAMHSTGTYIDFLPLSFIDIADMWEEI